MTRMRVFSVLVGVLGLWSVLVGAPALASGAGSPVIVSEKVIEVESSSALVGARIEPSGYATTCRVEYVTEGSFRASSWSGASSEPCASPVGSGSGEQEASVTLHGLSVSTAYRYRFTASNQAGDATASEGRFATFGIESLSVEALGEKGELVSQAGAHPFELVTRMMLNTVPYPAAANDSGGGFGDPLKLEGVLRDVRVRLPAGLIGNPAARVKCSDYAVERFLCPTAAQVGTIAILEGGGILPRLSPLFAVVPPTGVAARFAARINSVANATIDAHIRSGEDYGVEADSVNITGFTTVTGVVVKLWGLPEEASHDPERACLKPNNETGEGYTRPPEGCVAPGVSFRPFVSMPTSCQSPPVAGAEVDSYQDAGVFAPDIQEMPAVTGCGMVGFAPSLQLNPTSGAGDSASGLRVDLHVPQNEEPSEVRTADLKDATVTLPAGLVVNPSGASGLEGCSPSQIGLETAPNDIQRVAVQPREDHSFTLAYEGHETGRLSGLATAGQVQSALEALPGIGLGNVLVSGGNGGGFTVEYVGALAGRSVAQLTGSVLRPAVQHISVVGPPRTGTFALSFGGKSTEVSMAATAHLVVRNERTREIGYIEESSITGRTGTLVSNEVISGPGIPPDTRITAQNGRIVLYSDEQFYSNTIGEYPGTFTVSLPDNAYAQTVQEALEALSGIGANDVTVTGNSEGFFWDNPHAAAYTVVFGGALASGEVQTLGISPVLDGAKQELSVTGNAPSTRPLTVTTVRAGGTPHLNGEPANCPDASKLGTVEVDTPLLEHPLPGAMYLATPHENPFGSLLAVYIAIHDPISGVVVKLAGRVETNPQTGQLTTTFDQNPQLPFEDLKVNLFGENENPTHARAALTTPFACGSYSASSLLEPWSHQGATGETGTPDRKRASNPPFRISEGCVGSEGEAPNTPGFEAGTASPVAGTYSPFVLKLSREDGSQRFRALNVTLPSGLIGKIAGIEQCPQPDIEQAQSRSHEGEGASEQSSPSCPSGSEVGVVHVGAGSGAPFYVTGHAYFAGPYEGAPFSFVIVTPALAGPFDLGAVVVRAGLYIDQNTAQVTVKSDPFPTILDGIPLDIRTIDVDVNRSDFTLNPTSCATMSVTGQETSTVGQAAGLSDRFQAGGCTTLPFHPGFSASTQGVTSRKGGASLTVSVSSTAGQANIAGVHVELPKQLPSRNETLKLACRESVFAANPASCPEGSRVGAATADTPILANPLTGPAYLVSHGGAAFPDLEVVLQGEGITIVLDGKTSIDEKTGITSSSFETVPDAPISTFTLSLPEGPHSILGAPTGLCSLTRTVLVKRKVTVRGGGRRKTVTHTVKKTVPFGLTMPTTITGQNGAVITQNTPIAITGCPKTVAKSKPNAKKLGKNRKLKTRQKK